MIDFKLPSYKSKKGINLLRLFILLTVTAEEIKAKNKGDCEGLEIYVRVKKIIMRGHLPILGHKNPNVHLGGKGGQEGKDSS